MKMTTHPFDGHRVYDGCPDDTLQARINEEKALLEKLQNIIPTAIITYFPMEEKWQAHSWGSPLSEMHGTKRAAIDEALRRTEQ
jgi:hypothetical protein